MGRQERAHEVSADRAAAAHAVDRHVGLRIRLLRKERGWSQERLAEAVGLTFQQIQKYERGANRVSASKLWAIALALGTTVAALFEGLPQSDEPAVDAERRAIADDFLLSEEGSLLVSCYPGLPARVRRTILELVKALADL
jgi:transcriptional regulator with XRE-family HTH domain